MRRMQLQTVIMLLIVTMQAHAQTPDIHEGHIPLPAFVAFDFDGPPTPVRVEQASDEAILRGARVATDGPGLIEFFHKRVVKNQADQKKIDELIPRLGSGRFRDRETAMADLIAIGPPAKAALVRMAEHKDIEVRKRVAECLAIIEAVATPEVEAAALRLLRERKPAGACKALLLYLPTLRESGVEEEALASLVALAVVDGKIDPDVVGAFKDVEAVRRGAAAMVLARSGSKEQKDQVRQLVKSDPASLVRLRALQGLVAAKDKEAVGLLPALLTDAPYAQAEQARDLLDTIAGDKAPTTLLKDDRDARKKCRDDWERWWDANQAKVDLGKADVDLPWLNTNGRARAVLIQFIKAMETGNAEVIKRSLDVPFTMAGFMVIETRQELDNLFAQAATQAGREKFEYDAPRFLDTRQYLSKVKNKQLAEFLGRIPPSELRVMTLTTRQGGRNETGMIYVRVRGGKAHIVGVGTDEERMLTK